MNPEIITQAQKALSEGKKLVFLVGAGLSAESGIPTFRGKDGYWVSGSKNYKAEEIGTWRMFSHSAKEVWKWYLYRKSVTEFAQPNQGHLMLKALEDRVGDQFALISQNVDGLHKKAGNSAARTMLIHGDMDYVRCADECTRDWYPFPPGIPLKNRNKDVITDAEWKLLRCPKCGEDLRPNVLWFDETYNEHYYKYWSVVDLIPQVGVLFVLGTSGATSLPANVVNWCLETGAQVVEVNLDDNQLSSLVRGHAHGWIVRESCSDFLTELRDALAGV